MSISDKIQQIVTANEVVLFMKGSPDFPQCGFSGRVVQILKEHNCSFKSLNVLEDPDIRQGIKDYSNWPTIPQLYVRGEFIGGCDIVVDMHSNGQLQELLSKQSV